MEGVSNNLSSAVLSAAYGVSALKAALATSDLILQLLSDAGTLAPEGIGAQLDVIA